MGDKSRAFLKGGVGCVLLFFVLGVLAVLLGGYAHADLGGLILLFLIGGVVGLVVYALRGRKGAGPAPGRPWTCASCGAANAEGIRGCVACGEPRA